MTLGKEHLALGYANHIAEICSDAYREKIHLIAEDVAREVAGIPRYVAMWPCEPKRERTDRICS
jgi:hypothetical protein